MTREKGQCQRLLTDKIAICRYNKGEDSRWILDYKSRNLGNNKKFLKKSWLLKYFVSRQTISNWETNKSCPDVKSLITLSNIFNVSLDNFIKEDIKEMREIVEKATIKKFNVISVVFLIELIVVAISAYPLFSIKGNIGIIIWLCLFAITLYTASKIEKFKKSHDIQTYKEILAFIDGKQLTHDETQQEIGKRNYQKIIFAFIAGVIALIICFVVIFICSKIK